MKHVDVLSDSYTVHLKAGGERNTVRTLLGLAFLPRAKEVYFGSGGRGP